MNTTRDLIRQCKYNQLPPASYVQLNVCLPCVVGVNFFWCTP